MRNGSKKIARFGSGAALAGILAGGSLGEQMVVRPQARPAPESHAATKAASELAGFYCNRKALSPEERKLHHELTVKLAGRRLETEELADGYAFRLAPDSVSIVELGRWVAAERKCCPFFDFEIEAERDNGSLWLKLRGRTGVKAFIQSEFDVAR